MPDDVTAVMLWRRLPQSDRVIERRSWFLDRATACQTATIPAGRDAAVTGLSKNSQNRGALTFGCATPFIADLAPVGLSDGEERGATP
jgi:hypothetical protein